jgi:hypothetical protein
VAGQLRNLCNRSLPRGRIAVHVQRPIEAGDGGGEAHVVDARSATHELELPDVLERQPPPRATVFEGSDLELEHPRTSVDAGKHNRRPAVVTQPPAVADDQVSEFAELELAVPLGVLTALVDSHVL